MSAEASASGQVGAPTSGPGHAAAAPETTTPRPDGRWRSPAAVGIGSFFLLAAAMVTCNAYLFTAKIYEAGDFAANTIAVLQAKHFQLLTGNYSKEGFYHPGPAFLYVMAAGESLFHDALHLVPTPWNGQLLAILLLNAALIGAAIAVIARHAGSVGVTLAALLVVLVFVCVHPLAVNSAWFPYLYFAPTLLMIVSAASVATGQTFALPLLALSSWLCIHGQAEFLAFAPAVVIVALAGLFLTHRHHPRSAFRGAAWHWSGAAVVSALFALPIAIYTAEHWPGQFGNYLHYRQDVTKAPGAHHSLATSIGYPLRYWWPGAPTASTDIRGLCVSTALFLVALVLALRCPAPGLRQFLFWSLGICALVTVVFVYYAQTAISDLDILHSPYLGYFYWAVPLVVVIVAAGGTVVHLKVRRAVVLPLSAAVVAGVVTAALVPQPGGNHPATYLGRPQLPEVVSVLAAAAGGRPVVVMIADDAWVDAAGVVAYADRTGVRACVGGVRASSVLGVLFRSQSLCTQHEIEAGVSYLFSAPGTPVPHGQVTIARMPEALISAAAKLELNSRATDQETIATRARTQAPTM